MKKILSLVLVLMLCLSSAALAEVAVGMPNPMVETDLDGIFQVTGLTIDLPEEAEDVACFVIDDQMGQVQFTLSGIEMVARFQSAAEFTDISGLFYEWTIAEDGLSDTMTVKCMRYIGEEETVDLCLWYDAVPGIMYSLSAVGSDLDGFDITAIANMIYLPMQSEEYGYDMFMITDVFMADGSDTVVVQGCFGTIDMSKGEAEMEFIGFDEEEIYGFALLPDAELAFPADLSNPVENVAIDDLLAWYASFSEHYVDSETGLVYGVMTRMELDEEDCISEMHYVYLP